MRNTKVAAVLGGEQYVKQAIRRNRSKFYSKGLFLVERRRRVSIGTVQNKPKTIGYHGA